MNLQERKADLIQDFNYFRFTSCMDLSIDVVVTPIDSNTRQDPEYKQKQAQDIANFVSWFMTNIQPKVRVELNKVRFVSQ